MNTHTHTHHLRHNTLHTLFKYIYIERERYKNDDIFKKKKKDNKYWTTAKMWSVQTTLRTPSSNWSLRIGDVPCWICRSVYRSEFTDASRVCSIKPRTKFLPLPLTKLPASDKDARTVVVLNSVGQVDPAIQRPLLELCLFCQSVTKKKKKVKKI